jgi:acyl-coenzyme A thioesterase PaaI-like protein
MTEDPSIATGGVVDGHGPDAQYPPGPELRRLADAVRRVTDLVVRPGAPPAALSAAAEHIEAAADGLDSVTRPWSTSLPAMPMLDRAPHDFFPFSPMIGFYNPLAPPMECRIEDGTVHGQVRCTAAYEGPPGCVHGGVISGLFDELLGVANIASGVGAMTGTLTIVYRSPTPLYEDLRLEAHTTEIDGRKVHARGTLHAGDRFCAEAHGIFILVPHERFREHTLEHGAADAGAGS